MNKAAQENLKNYRIIPMESPGQLDIEQNKFAKAYRYRGQNDYLEEF